MGKPKAENKRKAKLTLAKYCSSQPKKTKTNSSEKSTQNVSVSKNKKSSSNSNNNFRCPYYKIIEKGKGIDLSTFRCGYLQSFKAPKTIASSISNTLN